MVRDLQRSHILIACVFRTTEKFSTRGTMRPWPGARERRPGYHVDMMLRPEEAGKSEAMAKTQARGTQGVYSNKFMREYRGARESWGRGYKPGGSH